MEPGFPGATPGGAPGAPPGTPFNQGGTEVGVLSSHLPRLLVGQF